jgi:hypothetical protein
MSRYDYSNLSSQDLEELTRDLLQAEWNQWLESFKTGRDKGIDLRYSHPIQKTTIIQCKHYLGSGFTKLLRHLTDEEKPKIAKLAPQRYVLVTTVPLSPANKDAILKGLSPYVLSTQDIVGQGDLDGLLSRHERVERANFKLWLTNTDVIERILHNAQICQTEFEVERIRRKLPLFVQNRAFPEARKLLDDHRIVVVSGPPGIGKTTLAEMLLFTYLEQGYEPVVITSELAEGKTFFRKEKKRIFYYDDFLGQIYLGDRTDYLGGNQDKALTDFMEMVSGSEHSRFILTTRAHILTSALQFSERLKRSKILSHRCILELDSYTFGNRARILYNHLYFSDLPTPYKKAVLQDDFFLSIIKHEHFNPRLIEWLSTYLRQNEVKLEEYRAYITQLLVSPHEIWLGAFRNQLSDAARDILLSIYTLGDHTSVADLEPVFTSVFRYRASKYNRATSPGAYQDALRELDGAFLSYGRGYASYLNPSIRDFIAKVIADDRDTAEDLFYSCIRFRQVEELLELADLNPHSQVAQLFTDAGDLLATQLGPLIYTPSTKWEGATGHIIDLGTEARIGFLAELAEKFRSKALLHLAELLVQSHTARWGGFLPEFTTISTLLKRLPTHDWFMSNGGEALYEALLSGMLGHIEFASAADWTKLSEFPADAFNWTPEREQVLDSAFKAYCSGGYQDERSECSTVEEMNALKTSLEDLTTKRKHDFSKTINSLAQDIAEAEEEERDEAEDSPNEGYSSSESVFRPSENFTDDDVRQMFDTLCES